MVATWTALTNAVLDEVNDKEGVFHRTDIVRGYLQDGELLIRLLRALPPEETGTLALIAKQPVYSIHATFPSFIAPLRATFDNVALRRTSLATLGRKRNTWFLDPPGVPESFFMIGATLFGIVPAPASNGDLKITYLSRPSTTGTSPTVDEEWVSVLILYARAICMGKESEISQAIESLRMFLARAQIERDVRFMEGSAQRPAVSKIQEVTREATD